MNMSFDEDMKIFGTHQVKTIGDASPSNSLSAQCCESVQDKVEELYREISAISGEDAAESIFNYSMLSRSLERIIQYCNQEVDGFDAIDAAIHYDSICRNLANASKHIREEYSNLA